MTHHRIHIVYIISLVEKSASFEWLADLLKDKYRITFVLLNPRVSPLENILIEKGIEVKRLKFSGKKHYPRCFMALYFFLASKRPQIIHAHLLDAQLLGLTAGWLAGIKKRIYTRHTSNFHHVYFRSGIKFDRWSNWLSTHVVSVSQATDRTLELESVNRKKIRKIHHGFQLSEFRNVDQGRIRTLKQKWAVRDTYPVVGVIARHIEWKGIQFIIPAFEKLRNDYPSALLVLANSHGPFHKTLVDQLATLPMSSYVLIPFEEDVVSLYAIFDVYVHTPVDETCEAFGQTYVEALAAEVPSIFTKSGIAAEFIEHKRNAWVVDFNRPEDIYVAMTGILSDHSLQIKLREEGRKSVEELFPIEMMVARLGELYEG